ncbi:hypothetical protein ABER02_10875 [Rossellomorea marisflavi]|uniref:hypothetical protein n=1 Tax=Rossellomorea marisflavi TaxID=189381 RepID=UPI003D289B1C
MMSSQINTSHLAFLREAKDQFEKSPIAETYRSPDDTMIALRLGVDRDCILIYELGDEIANFVQQISSQSSPRKLLFEFSNNMEIQMKANKLKSGWIKEHHQDITGMIYSDLDHLRKELIRVDKNKYEITELCAAIANYCMMVADNEGQNL